MSGLRTRQRPSDQSTLAETVQAYADHGFSPTTAAHALNIHPNTLVYQLDRWHTLTVWDPRTRDGLLRSPVAR